MKSLWNGQIKAKEKKRRKEKERKEEKKKKKELDEDLDVCKQEFQETTRFFVVCDWFSSSIFFNCIYILKLNADFSNGNKTKVITDDAAKDVTNGEKSRYSNKTQFSMYTLYNYNR